MARASSNPATPPRAIWIWVLGLLLVVATCWFAYELRRSGCSPSF